MPARRWGPSVRIAPLLGALAVGRRWPYRWGHAPARRRVLARVGERAIAGELLAELCHARAGTLAGDDRRRADPPGGEAAGIEVTAADEAAPGSCGGAGGLEADFVALLETADEPRAVRGAARTDLLLDKLARHDAAHEQEIEDFAEHREEYARGEQVRAPDPAREQSGCGAVLDTLQRGGDFAGLASALSIDPATRDQGGDMGWFERADYAPPIAEAAFALQPGETSGVIEAPDGWAIVRVEERRAAGYRPLEEVREEIRGRIERAKLPPARAEWIRRARAEATVRITDPELRAATEAMLQYAPPPQPVSLLPVPPAQ